jgi:hypothetical protein
VNCSGTKLAPKITPADAQTIFHKYLRRGVASSDCSGNSRKTEVSAETEGFIDANLTIDKTFFASGQDILIPVIIESPSQLGAFGFDLSFPSDALAFVGVESTDLTEGYNQLDGNVLPFDAASQEPASTEPSKIQILRIGGYKTDPNQGPSTGILVTLVFRRKGPFVDSDAISIIATYDDLQKASLGSRISNRQDSSQVREDIRQERKAKRMVPGKKFEY